MHKTTRAQASQSPRLRISLVIPAYNEEQYLGACLDAVAAQTVMPDEVIVVNNNSTDRTTEIAQQYPFVTLLHEKRPGLRFTRNTGMDAATGDVIGRIDADTILKPNWCEELRNLFGDEAVDAATGSSYYYDMPGKRLGSFADRNLRRLGYAIGGVLLYGSNMAMRRSVWKAIRPVVCMEGEFFEDNDLSIHLVEKGYTIYYDPKLVVGVAARMLDHPPRAFYRAMRHHDTTFSAHGQSRHGAAQIGKYIYVTAYPALKVMRLAYDAETDRISLRRLLSRKRRTPRPTSNT